MRKFLLWVLPILLLLLSINAPMALVFPLWMAVFLLKEPLKRFVSKFPLSIGFIASGTTTGLLTEFFAILQNWNLPPEQKILLPPHPIIDLLMGFFYYSLFILTWYLILQKWHFSQSAVFLISGLFGLATEQEGAILAGIVTHPFLGALMGLFVMSVYGIFPMLAYLLTEGNCSPLRCKVSSIHAWLCWIAKSSPLTADLAIRSSKYYAFCAARENCTAAQSPQGGP